MVAYSYKGRFVASIRVGLGLPVLDLHYELGGYAPRSLIQPKTQTIRGQGLKRHARQGEMIQHYHAQRSPKCFKIGEGRCKSVDDIRIYVHADGSRPADTFARARASSTPSRSRTASTIGRACAPSGSRSMATS